MITSSNLDTAIAPSVIKDFDPAEIGNSQYIVGHYHDYFDEDVITIMAPVIQGFRTEGYLLIHKPVYTLEETCSQLMVTVHIILGAVYVLAFLILVGFHFFVFRPLRKITDAATQYASGNLDYEIPVYTQDEIGYLLLL